MGKLTANWLDGERASLTPELGFALVGIDYLSDPRGQLYMIECFEMYQDALKAKKARENPGEYLILYKGADGECCYR